MTGYQFWKSVDERNPYPTALELSKAMGVKYEAMKQWRADSRIPKAEDLLKLSRALHISMETLLTGEDRTVYPKRIDTIARNCLYRATETDLAMIERILRIPSEFEVVEKKDDRASGGTIA